MYSLNKVNSFPMAECLADADPPLWNEATKPFQIIIFLYLILYFQAFATSNLPIKKLDFSNNAIRRLADKTFAGIQVFIYLLKNNHSTATSSLIHYYLALFINCLFFFRWKDSKLEENLNHFL